MTVQDDRAKRIARLSRLKPETLEGIKRLAKDYTKLLRLVYYEALNTAAKQAGFNNYREAQKKWGQHDPAQERLVDS